jgi:hypothetical protein
MSVIRQLRQIAADDAGVDIAFRADVHAGLSQRQKAIPARWFYDATGSALFEDITALPEYYPTRSETDLLTRHAGEMAAIIGPGRAVVELGSGSSTKTPLLLEAIAPAAYVPVDISGDFLRDSAAALAARFAGQGPIRSAPLAAPGEAFDVVLNATAAGLGGQAPAVPAVAFGPQTLAYDLVYGPAAAAFLALARTAGARACHDGLGMLVEQAAEAFWQWRGVRPATAPVIAALRGAA